MPDKQISVVADYDGTWDGKWLCADSPLPPGTGPYKLIPYIRADLHEALRAENARLRESLAFYADSENWKSDPDAWERVEAGDHDPETLDAIMSHVEVDGGKRARAALKGADHE